MKQWIGYYENILSDEVSNSIMSIKDGWKSSTCGIKNFSDLPKKAQIYITFIEKFVEAKVSTISTSPERNDTILIENPFKN